MRISHGIGVWWLAGLTAGLAMGQDQEAPAGPPRPAEAVQDYQAEAAVVREAVLAVFEEAELVLEPDPEGPVGEILTAYRSFGPEDFGRSVATPPPTVSRLFPYFMTRRLSKGRYRMRARIEEIESGSRLDLKAELLGMGHSTAMGESLEFERYSNGVIENYFHKRIQARLLRLEASGTD